MVFSGSEGGKGAEFVFSGSLDESDEQIVFSSILEIYSEFGTRNYTVMMQPFNTCLAVHHEFFVAERGCRRSTRGCCKKIFVPIRFCASV